MCKQHQVDSLIIGRIVFYTQLGLKICPRSLYLLYLNPKPNGRVKIKLKNITFQNFLKFPWLSKMKKKNNGFHFSLILSFTFSLFIHFTFLSHINWWDHVN